MEFYFIIFVIFIASIQKATSLDCSRLPVFSKDTPTCCRVPKVNLGVIPFKCEQHVKALPSWDANYQVFAHMCYADCVYKETGATVDGRFVMENVQRYLQQNMEDRAFIPVILDSFKACIATVQNHMKLSNLKSYPALKDGCSPYSAIIWRCVNTQTFLNCPKAQWRSDTNCNAARSYAAECDPLPHGPLPVFGMQKV